MTLKNFRAKDFKGDYPNPTAMASKRDLVADISSEPTPTTNPVIAADATEDTVPTGTTPEVLTWVGDDPYRAQLALDEELANEKPRKGLVTTLAEAVNAAAEETDENAGK